ncbi:MAG: SO_0444 family Cu/Zn efflux transporter [Kiritimatiellia bacterium]|nr:SO_0444 family Cu/Zn efflux transporter [Kiritimatiellia bacterium]
MQILIQFLQSFWQTAGEMAPFLLFGFAVTALSVLIVKPDFIERHLGAAGKFSVLKAASFGVPLPLCSCSVIPVAISLRQHGAGKGATAAFLVSTPQTGVDSIFVTYSLLGPVFAIVRPVAAFISGLIGGYLIDAFASEKNEGVPVHAQETECYCHEKGPGNKIALALRYGFITLPGDIGGALLLGLVISAAISSLLPPDFLGGLVGPGLPQMLIVMVAAIPIYVCATASVPVAAALIMQGITPGAAFVFLIAGPATNAATIAAVWKTLGRKAIFIYLLIIVVCALSTGWTIDLIFKSTGVFMEHFQHTHAGLPAAVKNMSAILLFALIGFSQAKQFWSYTMKRINQAG